MPEKIKAEIMEVLARDWDTRQGSFTDDMAGPLALAISDVYASLNEIPSIIWVDETSGPYIDLAAADLGIEPRKAGAKAKVRLQITGEAGYTVPAGATFQTADSLSFLTLAEAAIPEAGAATVEAEAREAGTAYNVAADTVRFQFDNASEITAVTNPEAATGGADQESDSALFTRYDLARKKPRTSGNKHDYEEWAMETDGVGMARVFPLRYGRGTVMVLIADENRKPVDRTVLDRCAAHIAGEMPIGGVELTVRTPAEVPVHVSALVSADGTTTPAAIRAGFAAALEKHFADISLAGSQVVYNQVGALLIAQEGVTDYSGLTLNGQAQSITLTDEQIPVVGEVAVTT